MISNKSELIYSQICMLAEKNLCLNEALMGSHSQAHYYQKLLKNILLLNPGVNFAEKVKISSSIKSNTHVISIEVINFLLDNLDLINLNFNILILPNEKKLVFEKIDFNFPFRSRPTNTKKTYSISIGKNSSENFERLTTSESIFLHKILSYIERGINNNSSNFEFGLHEKPKLKKTFSSLLSELKRWDFLLFRFDSICYLPEVKNLDYGHIEIEMHNVSVMGKRCDTFTFRICSSHSNYKEFGKKIKLQIISAGKLFSNRLFRDVDKFNQILRILEIRFEHPKDIDILTWKKLSEVEKMTLLTLSYKLTSFMNKKDANLGKEKWAKVIINLNNIFTTQRKILFGSNIF